MTASKIVLNAASGVGGEALNVEDVFSTYLYDGSSSAQTINNGIDLSGEGGMVWIKERSTSGSDHGVHDTERGVKNPIFTNLTDAENSYYNTNNLGITAFNSDGFTVASGANFNDNGDTAASWTFRKAPKFFDVQTFTYTSGSATTINHNLNCEVGMVIIKRTDSTDNWYVQHRSNTGTDSTGILNGTAAFNSPNGYSNWIATFGTTSLTTVTNQVSGTYVAYLFAHNDGDGTFGPDGDADIIKCGSYTGNSGNAITETLGFEPQWLLVKNVTTSSNWVVLDTMRNMSLDAANAGTISVNRNYAEQDVDEPGAPRPEATGFGLASGNNYAEYNFNTDTFIYIAIRRGPMAVPESATDVFDIDTHDSTEPLYDTSFPVDFGMYRRPDLTQGMYLGSRMQGGKELRPNANSKEDNNPYHLWDYQNGWGATGAGSSGSYSWMWRRAPSYFDVVAYTGNGTAGRTVSHNLGVAPEMMWVKRRDTSGDWRVYHTGLDATAPQDKRINLNEDAGVSDSTVFWNDTAPTDSNFTLGSHSTVNGSGGTYIAYLFASVDGVSKLGTISFTNGSTSSVDCGFSSGARFVLLKSVNVTGGWWVFDTERGIVSGNEPYLQLNTTTAQNSSFDIIDPLSSGFQLSGNTLPSDTYIFYAIA